LTSLKNTAFKLNPKLNILLFCLIYSMTIYSQGRIIDLSNDEGLPFCTVASLQHPDLMAISDISGYFTLSDKAIGDSILLTYIGYDTLLTVYNLNTKVYALKPSNQYLNEALIVANDGPAIALIKKVLRNRDQLNIQNLNFYQCQIYTKNSIGFDTDEDSISITNFNKTTKFPSKLFISESVINRQYNKPDKVFENIIASSSSVMKDLQFAIPPDEIQSLHFYKDYVRIFNKDYVNPISNFSWFKYHFNLDKIYEEHGDTLYKIDFWPKQKSYNCFKGMCIVSANGWAVQKITMQNANDEIYPFKLHQEYQNHDGIWFPSKLSSQIKFPSAVGKDYPFVLNQDNVFSQVTFQPIYIQPNKINITEINADSISQIQALRPFPLEAKNSIAYTFGKYLFKTTPMGYLLKNMQSFVNYQIPFGPIAIDALSVFQTNLYENKRLGVSLLSNMAHYPHFHLGGYVAYGLDDKAFKYGASIGWYFDKIRTSSLLYQYRHDIEGNRLFRMRNSWYDRYYSNLYASKESHRVEYRKVHSTHNISVGMEWNSYNPHFDYIFISDKDKIDHRLINSGFDITYRYFKGRQINFFNTYFITQNLDYPIFEVHYNQGIKGILGSQFNYQSLEINATKTFRWVLIGNTNITIQAGKVFGHPPIFNIFNAPASLTGSLTLQVPNSFQTMHANTYFSNQYVHLFLEQVIRRLYTTRFSTPELFVGYNAGWGMLMTTGDHDGIVLKDYSSGYHEVGLGFNSLIRLPIYDWFAFGINFGGYYNLKNLSPIKLGENFVLKVGMGFLF